MACPVGKKCEEAYLSAAVALTEWMYGIEGRQEMRRGIGKSLRRQSPKMPLSSEFGKEPLHLARDIFRVAKGATIFAEAHRPKLACPGIDILEQMMMDGSIMANTEATLRQWFVRTLGGTHGFKFGQGGRVANIRDVPENGGARIAVRVCYCVIVDEPSGPSHTFC
jgi:hypothetical protein